jgi:methyl-accepting chemotaxis protein
VKRLTSDNAQQQMRLDMLSQHAQVWRRDVAEKEIALMGKAETREDARAMEAKGLGKASMDSIRKQIADIEGAERTLFDIRSKDQQAAFSKGYLMAIDGTLVSVLIAVVAWLLLGRSIGAPIIAMTAAMGQLAAGNRGIEIPGVGRRDEVGAMAEAVDIFKRNAVEADRLAAVQQAEEEAKAQPGVFLSGQVTRLRHHMPGHCPFDHGGGQTMPPPPPPPAAGRSAPTLRR